MGAAGGGGKVSLWKIIARICAEILILGDSRLLAFQYYHITMLDIIECSKVRFIHILKFSFKKKFSI